MKSIKRQITPVVCTVAFLTLPITMSGCLIASSKEQSISGAYVQPAQVSQVKLNTSTMDDVALALGEPTSRDIDEDSPNKETWTYRWTKRSEDGGAVFLIFAGDSEKTVTENLHVAFVDGIAVKKWRD